MVTSILGENQLNYKWLTNYYDSFDNKTLFDSRVLNKW